MTSHKRLSRPTVSLAKATPVDLSAVASEGGLTATFVGWNKTSIGFGTPRIATATVKWPWYDHEAMADC